MCWVNRTMKGIQWAVYSVSMPLCGLVSKVTFSRSCLSCLVLASREHMVCWGATTVHTHLPSLSWAELYTCHDSSGLAGSTWAKDKTKRKRSVTDRDVLYEKQLCNSFLLSPTAVFGRLITWTLHKGQSDRVSGQLMETVMPVQVLRCNNHTFMDCFFNVPRT